MIYQEEFETSDEFAEYFQSIGYEFSKTIVDKCFELYNNDEQSILVISAYIEKYNSYFDITIDKNDILLTLQQNLPIFEQAEDYQGCAKIRDLIKQIEHETTK